MLLLLNSRMQLLGGSCWKDQRTGKLILINPWCVICRGFTLSLGSSRTVRPKKSRRFLVTISTTIDLYGEIIGDWVILDFPCFTHSFMFDDIY